MFLKAHGFNPDGTPVAPKGPQSTGLVTQSGEHQGKGALHPAWTFEQVNKALGKKMQTQFKSVAKAFRSADENKNGTLDKAEFRWVLAKFNIEMDDAHFAAAWTGVDRDNSGHISYNEFLDSFGKDIAGQADSGAMANKMTSIRMAENEARQKPVAEHPDWEPKVGAFGPDRPVLTSALVSV